MNAFKPGDKVLVEVQVAHVFDDIARIDNGVDIVGAYVSTDDLLPVPVPPGGDAIERAAVIAASAYHLIPEARTTENSDDLWHDRLDEDVRDDWRDVIRALAAAGLLAVREPGRSEAEKVGCGSCVTCDPPPGKFLHRMYVCATCGNKRCPAAVNCLQWECSGSNEPGQVAVSRAVQVTGTKGGERGAAHEPEPLTRNAPEAQGGASAGDPTGNPGRIADSEGTD